MNTNILTSLKKHLQHRSAVRAQEREIKSKKESNYTLATTPVHVSRKTLAERQIENSLDSFSDEEIEMLATQGIGLER